MPRITTLIAIAVIGLLTISGVIKVSFDPSKISEVPGAALALKDGQFGALSHHVIRLKRKGELFFTERPEARLEKSLGYIESDAQQLTQYLSNKASDPGAILSQAELLADSLAGARSQAATLDAQQLAILRLQSDAAFSQASGALNQLQELQAQYQLNQDRLAGITSSVQQYLSKLNPQHENQTGAVAGTKDEEPSTQSEPTKIPFKF